MNKKMICNIVSNEKVIFSGEITWITVVGVKGELGITPGHAPLLAEVVHGPVHIKAQNDMEYVYYVSGGYLEVLPTLVTVLADTTVRAEDINEESAVKAKEAATKAILNQKSQFDYGKAASELAEATAMIRTLNLKEAKKL